MLITITHSRSLNCSAIKNVLPFCWNAARQFLFLAILVQSLKPVKREYKLLLVRMLLFYFAQVLNGYSGCKSVMIQTVHLLISDLSPSCNVPKCLRVKGHLLCVSCCLLKYKIQCILFLGCSVSFGTIFLVSEDEWYSKYSTLLAAYDLSQEH